MASAAIMDAFIRKGLLGLFLVLLPVISSADEDPIAIIGKMKGDYTFSPPAAARFFPSSQKAKAGDILMNAMGMLGSLINGEAIPHKTAWIAVVLYAMSLKPQRISIYPI